MNKPSARDGIGMLVAKGRHKPIEEDRLFACGTHNMKIINKGNKMQTQRNSLISVLVAATLLVTAAASRAEHEKQFGNPAQMKVSDVIGKPVKNNEGENLGKVDDLIVNSESGTVPFLIIAHGGALGVGRTKTAVPMSAVRCSSDHKAFILPASKDELKAASKTATGSWAKVSNAEWAQSVDGYYGESGMFGKDNNDDDRRLYVRDPQPKGAELLITPTDSALCQRICDSLENVQVSVNNGVATLSGRVESQSERRDLEMKVKSIPGVQRVDNRLHLGKNL